MDLGRLLALEEEIRFTVTESEAGSRLDAVLSRRAPWASRGRISCWIREGRVSVGGAAVLRPGRSLPAGREVRAVVPKTPRDLRADLADLLPLAVAGRGEGWVAVDKPPGLPCHPAGGEIKRTLLVAAAVDFAGKYEEGGPWLAHRLDRETSGLVAVALSRPVQIRLAAAFARRRVRRLYLARVRGCAGAVGEEREVDLALAARPGKPMRVAADPAGIPARTRLKVLAAGLEASDLLVEPITGRRHQIRVHLAALGRPVLGDRLYDPEAVTMERMFLHAQALLLPQAGPGAPAQVHSRTAPFPEEVVACARFHSPG